MNDNIALKFVVIPKAQTTNGIALKFLPETISFY